MIANSSPDEFPCIEATRCLITEKEIGMRLTVKTLPYKKEHVINFSKGRNPTEEWYIHLDSDSYEGGEGPLRRLLQLRHSETGQYLCSDDKGRVSCTSISDASTYWWMIMSAPSSTASSSSLSDSPGPTDGQYILMAKEHTPRLLTYKGFAGSESDEDFQLITSKNLGEPSTWTLKFTSGELCFMSNPVMHCNLRCNLFGQLSLNNGLHGWEVFRFVECGDGDVLISSWTHYTKFLSSNVDGEVYATDSSSNSLGFPERWQLEAASNGLYIKNVASRRYLSVGRRQHEALWTTTKPNDYALWHINAAHSHIYYLTSLFASTVTNIKMKVDDNFKDEDDAKRRGGGNITANEYNQIYSKHGTSDMHVSSRKGASFLTKNKRKWEEWKIEITADGYITFFSIAHQKYLGCNSKGDVHTTTSKGSWCFWEKQESPNGGVMFLSREHQRYLAVGEIDGSLRTSAGDEETSLNQCWRMDPCLPRSTSGGKIAGTFIIFRFTFIKIIECGTLLKIMNTMFQLSCLFLSFVVLKTVALAIVGAMGLAITIAMPFAVLGAIEAVGATVTELALLGGVSVEALASVGVGVGVGVGMVSTAVVRIPNDSNAKAEEVSATTSEFTKEYNFASQRPISGWKSWVNNVSKSPPLSPRRL